MVRSPNILKGDAMLEKVIKYTDYNGNPREEVFMFNVSTAEAMEMANSVDGGWIQQLQNMVQRQDAVTMMATFKGFILASYGEKSPDGRRFIKSKELSDAFSQTEAYSVLYMELYTNSELAAAFVNGVLPKPVEQPQVFPK